MRVLITNPRLENYAGTEVVVRDLSLELQRQGHEPLVYSPKLGAVAKEIRSHGIEVTDQLSCLPQAPEIIHGHHHPQVIEALLHFPQVPAIFVCHGFWAPVEAPFYFPRIFRYVAVDGRCRKRIESVREIPPARIEVIPNSVDLDRFQPRPPLPSKPKCALVFSNYASPRTHLPAIRSACRDIGLDLDVLGVGAGAAVGNPESILPRYDVVFGKGRCALEAIAVGSAVVVCDFFGAGPMVTSTNLDRMRSVNFGIDGCMNPLQSDCIRAEVELYNAVDAATVSRRVRNEAGIVEAAVRWTALYRSALDEFHSSVQDFREEIRALGMYMTRWSYGKRVDWEWQQLERIRGIPVIGAGLRYLAHSFLRKLSEP
jgi:hypothetical protein